MAQTFIGFSTVDMDSKSGWKLTGIDLIKKDLMNHFYTRRGERVMDPLYGTIIWDMLFEPFTDSIKDIIVEDVVNIIDQDSRVSLTSIDVSSTDHGIMVAMNLKYEPWDSFGTFAIEFDRRAVNKY